MIPFYPSNGHHKDEAVHYKEYTPAEYAISVEIDALIAEARAAEADGWPKRYVTALKNAAERAVVRFSKRGGSASVPW